MDSLPFHLLEEILLKLDRKSLVMMQCTEKSINSHISDDPYFNSEYSSRNLRERVCGSETESELGCDKINQSDGTTTQVLKTVPLVEAETSNPDLTMYRFEVNAGASCWRLSETSITCSSSILKPDHGCFDGVVSAMEVDEKVDEVMTMAGHDKRISSLSRMIMRLINEVSPNVQSLLKRKETQIVEEKKKLKRKVRSGSKFLNVERINKRIRVM